MTPLPKRRHTRSRSGKRRNSSSEKLVIPALVKCTSCGELKYPHTICASCGKYGNETVVVKES